MELQEIYYGLDIGRESGYSFENIHIYEEAPIPTMLGSLISMLNPNAEIQTVSFKECRVYSNGKRVSRNIEVFSPWYCADVVEESETSVMVVLSRYIYDSNTNTGTLPEYGNIVMPVAQLLSLFGADIYPRMVFTWDGVEGRCFYGGQV